MLLGMISDANLREATFLLDNRTLLQSTLGMISHDKWGKVIIDNRTLVKVLL